MTASALALVLTVLTTAAPKGSTNPGRKGSRQAAQAAQQSAEREARAQDEKRKQAQEEAARRRAADEAAAAERGEALRRDCTLRGGQLRQVGMAQEYACVVPMKDAGKACDDGSECDARVCLAKEESTWPWSKKGACAPTDSHFGCAAQVVNGVRQRVLCAD